MFSFNTIGGGVLYVRLQDILRVKVEADGESMVEMAAGTPLHLSAKDTQRLIALWVAFLCK